MSNEEQLSQILMIALVVLGVILGILVVVYVGLLLKKKKDESTLNDKIQGNKSNNTQKNKKTSGNSVTYGKESIFKFMEFDKIEDNMIIQRNGLRYVMVMQCQGVNYDLLSKAEKNGVEEGFLAFLNTLRFPIQLYIQTRTVNLDKSIEGYKENINQIERRLAKNKMNYETSINMGVDKKELDKQYYEIVKQTNLLEYGKDIIKSTQRMSKNRNVLNNKYYIVMYYYPEEISKDVEKDEIQEMAFSELYTRAQAMIRALYSCDVSAKIMNSGELAELLYVAYNRDESETFDFETAIKSGYTELYSTAPDIWQKKLQNLDKTIEDRAIEIANESIEIAKTKIQEQYELKTENIEELAEEMARLIIDENTSYIGEDIAARALRELDNKIEEWKEETKDEEEYKKSRRGRPRKAVSAN